MRRRFNQNILPSEPPPKSKWMGKNIGSPFNRWFRSILSDNNITMKEFCNISGCIYGTAVGWRYKNEPRIHGKIEIAKGLEKCGLGQYPQLLETIKKLCKR